MNVLSKIAPSDEQVSEVQSRPAPWRKGLMIGAPLALLAWGGYAMTHHGGQAAVAMPPPMVTVATPIARSIDQWDDYAGRFDASKTVEVRPRISGQITGVRFQDGAIVRQGQLLFTIDQRPYAAALAQAQASVASAKSDLDLARANLARSLKLVDIDGVSQSDIDQLRARQQAAEAALAGAEAQVRARVLDMSFTQVRAPISGRISDRRVDAGNLVAGGEGSTATLLTTINALDPIYFSFDASEALFLKTRRAEQQGTAPSQVQVKLQDENDYQWKGRLDFTDNGLDPHSGTIRVRAVVDNPRLFLTPGMFGNARLASSGTVQALLVPDAAVQTDQARKTVLVVATDGSVVAKAVDVGPVVDGLRVIRAGVAPADRVVIAGMQSAMPGMKVTVRSGRIAPDAAAAAPVSIPVAAQATLN